MTSQEALEHHLIYRLHLPALVVEYLMSIYKIIQFFDDVADGDTDKITREDFNEVLYESLVGIHKNRFFLDHAQELLPIVSNGIFKWQASDSLEREKDISEITFVWRAGYFDLVMQAVTIIHGHKKAVEYSKIVLKLYGEKYSDYIEEFFHA